MTAKEHVKKNLITHFW